ncbi:protein kinase, partial [Acinetobacter baumannii]
MAKLLDFGIAKRLTPELDANQTKTTAQAGSPGYMSPEQCNSTELSPRSDIYSMSCLLYQCLIGKLPFEGESPTHTMYLHATQAPAL